MLSLLDLLLFIIDVLLFDISQLVTEDCDPSKDLGGLGSCPLRRVTRGIIDGLLDEKAGGLRK